MNLRISLLTAMLGGSLYLHGQPCSGSVDLSQGWNCKQQMLFWYTSQGSLLVPANWFVTLEQANSTTPFSDPDNIKRYKYLISPVLDKSNMNGKLPIGFALTAGQNPPYVGMTCAACHTAWITWNGNYMLVDGGPAMAHFEMFLSDLVAGLRATHDDADKFARFLKAQGSTTAAQLKNDLQAKIDELDLMLTSAQPHGDAGFGRVDAFGFIFNRVVDVKRPADAPVSYPHLWTTPRMNRVQWNGIAPNRGLGPVMRNIGEVLGVFASLDPKHGGKGKVPLGYRSSADIDGLTRLESWIQSLQAPMWPKSLGGDWDIDLNDVAAGATIYDNECKTCHVLLKDFPGAGGDANVPVKLLKLSASEGQPDSVTNISTDPSMATNFVNRQSLPSHLAAGPPRIGLVVPLLPNSTSTDVLNNAVVNTYLGQASIVDRSMALFPSQAILTLSALADSLFAGPTQYRARPLNGIWATAPFLHNGSVPNLTELLTVPGERRRRFCVGDREYDPTNGGFRTIFLEDGQSDCPQGSVFDTTQPGNHNLGHAYGTLLMAPQKKQLIAFLKQL